MEPKVANLDECHSIFNYMAKNAETCRNQHILITGRLLALYWRNWEWTL